MDMLYRINAGWRDLMDNKSDPRTADWPLMSSPFPTIAICMAYVYIVKVSNLNLLTRSSLKLVFLLTVNNFDALMRLIRTTKKTRELNSHREFLFNWLAMCQI